jgi:hypothetical protein
MAQRYRLPWIGRRYLLINWMGVSKTWNTSYAQSSTCYQQVYPQRKNRNFRKTVWIPLTNTCWHFSYESDYSLNAVFMR